MERSTRLTRVLLAGGLSATALRWLRRPRPDPAHAPGKRHRGPVADVDTPTVTDITAEQNQPWVRRSHSDSQKRRFRR